MPDVMMMGAAGCAYAIALLYSIDVRSVTSVQSQSGKLALVRCALLKAPHPGRVAMARDNFEHNIRAYRPTPHPSVPIGSEQID
eukprot:3469508-Prymnesium_polylepis.2